MSVINTSELAQQFEELYNQLGEFLKNKSAHQSELPVSVQRERIAQEYDNQKVIAIELKHLGTQSTRYAHMNPSPKGMFRSLFSKSVPIIIIGGLSNDIDPLALLGQEAALQGREVILFGYPESVHGSVSSDFVKAVISDKSFSTHALFFMEAIQQMVKNREIELWGYSTGCPIIAQMLTHHRFSKRVKNAALICPAASVDQTKFQLLKGLAHEAGQGLKYFKLLPNYSLILPNQSSSDASKKQIFNALFERIQHQSPVFEHARVKKGGKIIVISAQNDQITKSYYAEHIFAKNPQMEVVKLEKTLHIDPIIHADKTVNMILYRELNTMTDAE